MSDSSATQASETVVTKTARHSVEDTVAKLSELVKGRGLTLFAIVDHSGEARRIGLALCDTKLVIFGSPEAGTPAMQAVPLLALDLPLKVLVWDNAGETKVSYTAPATLAARFNLSEDLAKRLAAIDPITDALVAD
jgi:uncharacterized protein (DUF302 family)